MGSKSSKSLTASRPRQKAMTLTTATSMTTERKESDDLIWVAFTVEVTVPATMVRVVTMVASTVMIHMAVMALIMIQLYWNVSQMILQAVTTLMLGLKIHVRLMDVCTILVLSTSVFSATL